MSVTALSTMFPDGNEPFIAWLAEQMPGANGLKLDHAKQLTFGHSNQTWDVAVSWDGGGDRYIFRSPPDGIGLLCIWSTGARSTPVRRRPRRIRSPPRSTGGKTRSSSTARTACRRSRR